MTLRLRSKKEQPLSGLGVRFLVPEGGSKLKNWGNERPEQVEEKKGFLERIMNLFGFETEIEIEEVYEREYSGLNGGY